MTLLNDVMLDSVNHYVEKLPLLLRVPMFRCTNLFSLISAVPGVGEHFPVSGRLIHEAQRSHSRSGNRNG